MAVTDAGSFGAGPAYAGGDREHGTQALNAELQDKGFLLTSTEDLIKWARTGRSEERRVGKECRSRWSPYH